MAIRGRHLAPLILVAGAALALPGPGGADPSSTPQAEVRVAFHLAEAEALHEALAPVVTGPCPRFPTPAAWDAYLETLRDQGVTFAAHLDEAWREAKSGGDDLRRRVKAARREWLVGNPTRLVGKLTRCAWRNGSPLDPWRLWREVSAQVPDRRREVARAADLATSGR